MAWTYFVFLLPPSYFLCFPFDWLNLASRSYTILCPSVVKPDMSAEAITKALLDAVNIEGAFYRLGSNKVVSFPWQTTRAHVIHLKKTATNATQLRNKTPLLLLPLRNCVRHGKMKNNRNTQSIWLQSKSSVHYRFSVFDTQNVSISRSSFLSC